MSVILHFLLLGAIALAVVLFLVLWIVEMLDKVSTLEEYAPGLVHFARHKKWHPVLLLICIIFLVADIVELYAKEVPEVPLPPVVKIEAPRPPSLNIVRLNPPIEKQCWIKNYGAPAIPGSPPWGMATLFPSNALALINLAKPLPQTLSFQKSPLAPGCTPPGPIPSGHGTQATGHALRAVVVDAGQEDGDDAEGGQPGGDFVNVDDAERVGHMAQHRSADASHPEGEAEE